MIRLEEERKYRDITLVAGNENGKVFKDDDLN